jgi:hypothetical protein
MINYKSRFNLGQKVYWLCKRNHKILSGTIKGVKLNIEDSDLGESVAAIFDIETDKSGWVVHKPEEGLYPTALELAFTLYEEYYNG